MKICHVRNYTAPARNTNGVERVLEALSRATMRLGHQVELLINPGSEIDIPIVQKISPDVDVVHYHGDVPEEFGHVLRKDQWISSCHSGPPPLPHEIEKETRHKDNFVGVSQAVCNMRGFKTFVHNGLNPDDFLFKEEKGDYFLWIGGTDWGEQKALFSTIQFAKTYGIKLVIAGGGQNKSIIEQVKQLCDSKITYVGMLNGDEKKEVMAYAKAVFMLGMVHDACPVTNIEAFMSGTPVIARNVGAHPEMINDKSGILCKNERDILQAVFVGVDKIKPSEVRQHAVENFSDIKCSQNYLKLYQNMLEYGSILNK